MLSSGDEFVDETADTIAMMVAGGSSADGAIRRLSRYTPNDVLANARELYEKRTQRVRSFDDVHVLLNRERETGTWYAGPRPDHRFWPVLEKRLRFSGIPDESMNALNRTSDRVVSLLRPPGTAEINVRGLVLGYVQSGKTTNFMSVIAKAADVGYRLVIVLSGLTENLRAQTQGRLQSMLVEDLEAHWHLLTYPEADFTVRGNARQLLSNPDHRLLAVVKKNPHRLRRLVRWMRQAGDEVVANCPILVIDDEADQASINVSLKDRSSINGLIGQILRQPKTAYIAYTATPFANLLIDPEKEDDLYPRDFVVDLPRPDGYFGPEKLFGRDPLTIDEVEALDQGLDIIRQIPEDEAVAIRPPRVKDGLDLWEPDITLSLIDALQWFLLATAARRARPDGGLHNSMLIHTSMNARAHFATKAPVEKILHQLRKDVTNSRTAVLASLRSQWEEESAKLPSASQGLSPVTWAEIEKYLPAVLADVRVIVDNYLSKDRLSYGDPAGITAVVIGGNTLSRGLTLEGLTCSYFVRASSAYDTQLQMGRWFGYRRGYGDLPRIWMTDELKEWFFALATVEEEIRRDIRRYEVEELSPLEVPVRIRTHPAMAITSAAKMRDAVDAEISFSRHREQTILFHHRDQDWLLHNQDATRRLVQQVGATPVSMPSEHLLFRSVPSALIEAFLSDYRFHEEAFRMKGDLLREYIASQNRQGFLRTWNVVVMNRTGSGSDGAIDLGLGRPVGLLKRSRLPMPSKPYANIKALISTTDRVADLQLGSKELGELHGGKPDDNKLRVYREDVLGDVGLLCVYPIDKVSEPRRLEGSSPRVALDAVEHVIGLGIFFPKAGGVRSEITYKSADLSNRQLETEIIDLDAIDELDAQS
ncbi:hypothetical protein BCD49_00245 [Pseudofrankia sp. EUN1h]|nr:hypothetical protein BCD49_00245 [Pseudofrankia sp. EUN1h]